MNDLISLAGLPATIDLGPLEPLLNELFGPATDFIEVNDFFESEEDGVVSYTIVLGVQQSFLFPVPGFSEIQLGIVRDSEDKVPLIVGELVIDGAPPAVSIKHFPLRVVIENPLLLPVPPEDDGTPVLDGFSFEVEGSLTVSADLSIHAELESFTLPPFTIDGTGLVLGLEDCRLITAEDDVDEDIVDLGFDEDFRGIHAASAQVYWDIPFQVAGADLPGLRADLENLALGNQGVSVAGTLSWPVVHDGQQFDLAQTELYGALFDWEFALEELQLVLERNVPIGTGGIGYLRVPLLDRIVRAELGYRVAEEETYRFNVVLDQAGGPPLDVPLGDDDYQLQLADLHLEGEFTSDGEFQLEGQAGVTLNLPGLTFSAGAAGLGLEHRETYDAFRVTLTDVDVDGYGQIDEAQLVVVFGEDDNGDTELWLLELIAKLQWQDLAGRIQLDQDLALLPLPPDDAEIELHASWVGEEIHFSVQAELDDVDKLWRFLPEEARPQVADASIDIELTADGDEFIGEMALDFLLQLPELATIGPLQAAGLADVVTLEAGDESGFIRVRFAAELSDEEDAESAGKLTASVEDPLALTIQLPGLTLPEPPIHIEVTSIGVELSADGSDVTGILELAGDFTLRPILPDAALQAATPMMAAQLDRLLDIARQIDLTGSASLTLGVASDNAWFETACEFGDAGLELDLFDMLANALGGAGNLFGDGAGNEIDLDIDVSVELKRIALSIGSEEPSEDGIPFGFGLTTRLGFAGQQADLVFELTHESLSFGFDILRIPIAIPKLPLSRDDLDRLRDGAGEWDYANGWLSATGVKQELDAQIDEENRLLGEALDLLEQYREEGASELDLFQLEFRTIPEIQQRLFDVVGRKFLYEAILAVQQMLELVGVEGSTQTYQQFMEVYQDAVDTIFGSLHYDTELVFEITEARFVLPFNDPSDIRVEGGASIGGFVPDDPLSPLADLVFKLGLSADAIFFSVEGGAEPIPLPDFGRNPGSAVNLDRLVIGYGYSKNSLKIDFAGELILSEQLIDDADTSAELGFGVRLPENTKLQFKLDLIPIVLGEVDFVIPLVALDIDLRSDTPPPPPPFDGQCRPAWDGLQLHVPGVVRADLKRYKFSPFFGPLPATNYEYIYDFEIGNDDLGLRHVADYQSIAPVLGMIPIPFLADTVPFFERYCMHVSVAGFGLSFDLTRPFPKPSPLLIFELLGFLSDPSVPIDPNGHIAGLMYAELHHGRITAPERVRAFFPAAGRQIGEEFRGRLDITTVIGVYERLRDFLVVLKDRLAASGAAGIDWVRDIAAHAQDFSAADVLRLLPYDMRTVEAEGRFLHFQASATFILALPGDIDAEFGEADEPAPPPPPGEAYEVVYQNDFGETALTGWRRYNRGLKRGRGNWRVKKGQLTQNNNVGDNSRARYGAMLVYTEEDVGDLRLLATCSSSDDDGMGLVFHVQSERTFYRFRMTEQQREWRLDKLDGGKVTTLFSTESAFKRDQRYDVRVEAASRGGASAGLPLKHSRLGPGRTHRPIEVDKLVKTKQRQPVSVTRIRVWVNGVQWCDVEDDRKALTHGHIGLDSWWNPGARFDNLEVFERRQTDAAVGRGIDATDLVPLSETLSADAGEPPAALAAFSRQDIAAAMAGSPAFAVAVAARVGVAGSQVFSMLGWMANDGRFRLLSRLNVSPLQLTIAGMEIPLPLEVEGRLLLAGRSAGADSHSRVEAAVHGEWTALPGGPGEDAFARFVVGSPADPVSLRLNSDREFALQGHGALQLFSEQLVVTGEVDMSHAHAMIAGDLDFVPDIYLPDGTRVAELHAAGRGRVGPGRRVEFEGEGQLKVFGRSFAAGTVRLAERLVELTADLGAAARIGNWSPAGLPLKQIRMSLAGRLDFRSNVPSLMLRGEGGFKLHGAQLEGTCRIETQGSDWLIAAAGRLYWQGRNWVDGALVLTDDSVEIRGRADFGIRLTPTQLPAGIEIAGLHLRATVSGRLTLNGAGQLVSWEFDLDWQLAVKLPGTDAKQALPIATQQLKVQGTHAGTDDLFELSDIVAFNGLTLFDFNGFTLDNVPTVDLDGGEAVYVHDSLGIDADGDGGSVTFLTPIDPGDESPPDEIVLGFSFWEVEQDVNLPALTLPVPTLSTENPNDGTGPLFHVPGLGTTSVPLGRIRFDNADFGLKLAWKDGKLGVRIAGEDTFVPFSPNVFLGIIVTLGSA